MVLILLVTTVALSGCSTTSWKHPSKKQTGSYLDLLHCKQEANQFAQKSGDLENITLIQQKTDKCMIEKYGWAKEKKYPIRYYLPFPFNILMAYQ